MILYPNAKINIGLRILSKREDGFHDIETLFYPVELADILEIVESAELTLNEYGIQIPGKPGENICIRAYNLVKEDFDIPPVEISLFKNIPAGAGLGGGSSDGAHTILLLDKLFNLNLTHKQKRLYASRLGSDCPFFIENLPMIGSGRGDILEPFPLDLSLYTIKVVTPPCFVSTAEAYRTVVPRDKKEGCDRRSLGELLHYPVEQWKDFIVNDFEENVFKKFPQLAEYKEQLYRDGALYASMSGSGSSLFGIFSK
ncbi:MAG: 4-(cytidine 5'-diphospho)-2-C-methyl-D-erythritol kinase [Bacteroidetes bacterium]|uniref:4-diphosphocytidyl-2-C-methyl-D-erythritol kinase n=1 Tax=Candidatus Egerieousia excrementavium TaxID=2840778 RepID=A0A9D9DN93_9BACT|nr:4-(cytidine 5'-diphospho)-2-C-methyl-D-erythritol kinase [Candidatus Egerieousia excrementavium]